MASIDNATAQPKEKKAGKQNNAAIWDVKTLIAAGINPVTGLPLKAGNVESGAEKAAIKKNLRILDEQDAVMRYKWYNLPFDMSSDEFERLLYYKGQLAVFYLEDVDQFYAMPYALDGSIDFYGRYNVIHPIPFAEGTGDEEKRQIARQRQILSTLKLNCVYDVVDPEDLTPEVIRNSCVLLKDYTPQLSQTIIPRQELQEGILDIMAEIIPYAHTALANSTGIQGMRVNTEDEQSNVEAANDSINRAALNQQKYMAIIGKLDFQDLTGGEVAKSEEFLMLLQALDNFRLSFYGIDNGGLFEKKAHVLQSEQEMNRGNTGLVYDNGLMRRRHFCDVFNSIWDVGVWCDPGEAVSGIDINGDGMIADDTDQSGAAPGEQPKGVME